jgi:farnesyl diphosphate synthase
MSSLTETKKTQNDQKAADKLKMAELFDVLSSELLADLEKNYECPPDAIAHIKEMMSHTVPGGKLNRGLTVLHTARIVSASRGQPLTEQKEKEAAILGWNVEWLQAFFLVADDKMDSSVTRRGRPCWYRMPGVGNVAINDAFFLESQIYQMLRRHFSKSPIYGKILDLFHETTMQTEVGQLLDLTTQPIEGPVDLEKFTLKRYKGIVKYKTAFYTFYLPMALGMVLCGVHDDDVLEAAKAICLAMGEYFQIQDDYLDAYGAPEVIGKIGTDIQDKKCSWLVVQAMSLANDDQLKIIKDNYGIDDAEKIESIKTIYRELDLENIFKTFENDSYISITKMIAEFDSTQVPHEVFTSMLEKVYKRSK